MNRRKLMWGGLAAVVVLGVLVGGGLWWYLSDDAPDEVSLDAAVGQVDGSTDGSPTEEPTEAATSPPDEAEPTEAGGDGSAPTEGATDGGAAPDEGDAPEPSPVGVEGAWTVDTSVGEFSFQDSTGTFVGFRVKEELAGIGSTEAVGRTPVVSGTLVIEGSLLTEVTIEADLSQLTTDRSQRDAAARRALDTNQFPLATFTLTEPVDLGDAAATGEPVSVTATGDLTVHGVTQSVAFPLEAQLVSDLIVVVGSLNVVFADFGVSVPTAPIVASAEDNGPIELQLFFSRA